MNYFDLKVMNFMLRVRSEFRRINEDRDLTPDDRIRLKEFYLENFVTPRARKLLQKHFPKDFGAAEPDTKPKPERPATPRQASKDR